MNLNNFTLKSQEAIQKAHELALGFQHQAIENAHVLKGIFSFEEIRGEREYVYKGPGQDPGIIC